MNNLQSLFPLGLLPDRTVIFPQLLQLCHSHIPSKAGVFFHTLPSDSSESLLMLPIQLEKFLCVWESWERENGGDQEESEGREGQEIAFAINSLPCSITAGQKQQGCFLAVISSPTFHIHRAVFLSKYLTVAINTCISWKTLCLHPPSLSIPTPISAEYILPNSLKFQHFYIPLSLNFIEKKNEHVNIKIPPH